MKANEKTREAKQRFNDEHRRAEDAVASAAQLYEDLAAIKVNAEEAEERCEAERGRAEEAIATSLKLTMEANNAEQRHEANRLRLEKSLAEEVASKVSLAMNLKKAEVSQHSTFIRSLL